MMQGTTATTGSRAALPALLLLLLLCCGPAAGLAEVVVIANPDVPGGEIDAGQIERIYLGKLSRWSDGTDITPVMLKSGAVHEEFVNDYLERPVHRFVTYWRQMVFTGKGVPPRSFSSEEDLRDFVAVTPGSVGYVSPDTSRAGVKVLAVE